MTPPPTTPLPGDATEETGSIPVSSASQNSGEKQEQRRFLKLAARDLSEDELGSAAARRFLIAEIDRLDSDCERFKSVEARYNDLRVEHSSLTAFAKSQSKLEILSYISVSAGSIGVGAAPNFLSITALHSTGIIIMAVSLVLVIVSVLIKVMK